MYNLSLIRYHLKRFQSVFRAFSKRFQRAFESALKSKKILNECHFGVMKNAGETGFVGR
jgi:hypothetical protein